MMIKILLADDQILFLESLKSVIESRAENIQVVATALNGREAIQMVEQYRPEVALLDVRMPDMDGVEAARQINERYPEVRIVMLTTFDDDEYVRDALNYGAVGYLLKDIPPKKLIASIQAVKEGSVMMAPSIARKLVQQVAAEPQGTSKKSKSEEKPEWLKELSKRELEVLKLLGEGYDNRQIADQLYIAEQTVKNHVSEIYSKLGTHSRIKTMKMVQKFQYNDYLR